jgi:hypothetical protein
VGGKTQNVQFVAKGYSFVQIGKKETTDQSRSRNSCRKRKEKNNIGGKIIIQTGSV